MDLFDKCRRYTRAKELMANGQYPYFRPLSANEATRARINGREVIMVGSNNYLGLTHDPRVVEAARQALVRFGTSCTGSRFLNGTLELHEELEGRLAKFLKKEAALVFSTGFQANLGAISALVGKDDVIFCDRENHASIIDGCRLSFGEAKKFRHDDMADLRRMLEQTPAGKGRLIIVDGVFSMNGSITNLPAILELAEEFNARVMVDDAHGIGPLGATGRGTLEHFQLLDNPRRDVDIVTGTFSKSLASLGGFVAGSEDVIHYIKHHARPMIFSASCTPASTAAALAALTILEQEPWRVQQAARDLPQSARLPPGDGLRHHGIGDPDHPGVRRRRPRHLPVLAAPRSTRHFREPGRAPSHAPWQGPDPHVVHGDARRSRRRRRARGVRTARRGAASRHRGWHQPTLTT